MDLTKQKHASATAVYQTPQHLGLPNLWIQVHQGKLIGLTWLLDDVMEALFVSDGCFNDVPSHDPKHRQQSYQQNQRLINRVKQQLDEYFDHQRKQFDVPMDISAGTAFQQSVWRALVQIGYAEKISYAQLAKNINHPKAYRACANANGKNPISLIIPCHRVIASDGGIGGYTGGVFIKKILLSHEQALDVKNI